MTRSKLLICVIIFCTLTSCKLGRFIYYNFADINDHEIFPTRTISRDSIAFQFNRVENPIKPKSITLDGIVYPFDDYLEENNTVAFLVIRGDSILYENYWRDYDQASVVPSFSMAKSVTSILIGCAIEDGFIKSVDSPVTDYIPELEEEGFDMVTIRHLLQMTSGVDFNESYINPFGDVPTFYYGRNLRKAVKKMDLKK